MSGVQSKARGGNMNKNIFGIMLLLILMPFVYAAANNDGNMQGLEVAANVAQCRSDFVVGVMNSISSNVPSTAQGLNVYITKLPSDVAQLKTITSKDDFKTFVSGTLDVDFKSAQDAIKTARESFRGKNATTKDAREKMRSDFTSLRSTLNSCDFSAHKQFSDMKLQSYSKEIAKYQSAADSLRAKGVDTSSLNKVISDAQAQVSNFQTAVDSANDSKSLGNAINGFCIYNGCAKGANYHLGARFQIERLSEILSYTETKMNLTADEISSVQANIDAANSALAQVGTSAYTADSSKAVWDDIKAAANALKTVRSKGARK